MSKPVLESGTYGSNGKCFYEGAVHLIVGTLYHAPEHYLILGERLPMLQPEVRAVQIMPDTAKFVQSVKEVYPQQLQPLVQDILTIGTLVKASKGSFQGTVVGYEPATNRAICISQKIDVYKQRGKVEADRTRFVYALNELDYLEDVKFEVGKNYRLYYEDESEVQIVAAMESPSQAHMVALYNRSTGEYHGSAKKEQNSHDARTSRGKLRCVELQAY